MLTKHYGPLLHAARLQVADPPCQSVGSSIFLTSTACQAACMLGSRDCVLDWGACKLTTSPLMQKRCLFVEPLLLNTAKNRFVTGSTNLAISVEIQL